MRLWLLIQKARQQRQEGSDDVPERLRMNGKMRELTETEDKSMELGNFLGTATSSSLSAGIDARY